MKTSIKLTFQQQFGISIAVFIIDIILAHFFQTGLFHNLSWLIYGVLFFLNPVCPDCWNSVPPKKRKKSVRIAAVICIAIGLVTQFGI